MLINSVIREKRKQMGLTQEQMGSYLGVSTPAVNKWEKGVTYPDISLLPGIARLLNIDLNTLFDFNDNLTKQEIQTFSKKVVDIISEGSFIDGFTMGMEKIREYPNCTELIHSVAVILDGALIMYGHGVENKKDYEEQIINLYERVAKCDDNQIRNSAIFMLASKYNGKKEYVRAQEMIDMLPERSMIDKKNLQAQLFISRNEFTEATKILEHKLLIALNDVEMILSSLAEVKLKEKNNEAAIHLAQISKELVKEFNLWEYWSYIIPLQIAISKKDVASSIEIIEEALKSFEKSWDTKDRQLFGSISTSYQSNYGAKMIPSLLSEMKNNPNYEFLYSEIRFNELMERYSEKYCS